MTKTKKNKDTSVDVSENAFAMEQAIGGMVPPNAMDMEQMLLGAVMLDNSVFDDILSQVRIDYFYSNKHQNIFEAMVKLHTVGDPIDIVQIKEELKKVGKLESSGDVDYLLHLMDSVSTSANTEYYSRIIFEKFAKRRIIAEAGIMTDKAMDPATNTFALLDSTEQAIMEISGTLTKKKEIHVAAEIDPIMEILEEARHNKNKNVDGIPYGFDTLDEMTGGKHEGELIVIAGRPGSGKSAFSMNCATNAAIRHGKKVGVFSLEMTYKELIIRMIASECKVNGKKLKLGKLHPQEWEKVLSKVQTLKTGIYIDDSSELSILELRAKARKMKAEHGIDELYVDYLQLVKGGGSEERRDLEVATVSRGLKALAKDLEIDVIACAQLNRDTDKRVNKHPQLSDLRESGAIEQDADTIIFISRPILGMKIEKTDPDYNDIKRKATITIGKQRNGPTGEAYGITFFDEWATFENHISHQPNVQNDDSSEQPF